jgi:hypothetical protein
MLMQNSDDLQQCVYARQGRASTVCLCKAVLSFSSVFMQNSDGFITVFMQSSDELQQCVYAKQ